MQTILRSPFEARAGAGGGDPLLEAVLALYANGEQGALYYFTEDFTGLYQDAAGTVPVTAVGQPVGRVLDRSGRGNHASQSTTTARPLLQRDANGKLYLAFDGVDDFILTPNAFTFTDITSGVSGYSTQTTGNAGFLALRGAKQFVQWAQPRASTVHTVSSVPTWGFGNNVPSLTRRVLRHGVQGYHLIDGVRADRPDAAPIAATEVLVIGAGMSTPNYPFKLAGRVYAACVVLRALGEAEVSSLDAFLASRAGITLGAPIA